MADYAENTLNKFGSQATSFAQGLQPRRTAFNAGQKAEGQDFLGRYTGAINKQEALPDMYKRIGIELNLPNLQQSANTLNTTLANLPQTFGSATRGFDVNANQLARTIGQKASELTPVVTQANQALSTAQDQANKQIGFEQTQQQKLLDPYLREQDMLAQRQAREATGYSEDNQAELDTYIQKMKAGITLTEGEKTRANELAMNEARTRAQIESAKIGAEASRYGADRQLEGVKYSSDATKSSWY